MLRVMLGQNGPLVSAQGVGFAPWSEFYPPYPGDIENKAEEFVKEAFKLGINFFDTADMYGQGKNEELLGKVLRPIIQREGRNSVVIATKGGIRRGKQGEIESVDCSPEYIRFACEASLQRLGVNYVDIYYLHRPDGKTPIRDSIAVIVELVKTGKIKYIGLSEFSAAQIKEAQAAAKEFGYAIAAVQSEYSILNRDVENNGVLEVCAELNIGFVPFYPIGRGFLSSEILGNYLEKDLRSVVPQLKGKKLQTNLQHRSGLERIAASHNCSLAQISLAWLMQHDRKVTIVPIPGTKKLSHLGDNVAASEIVLTKGLISKIDEDFKPGTFVGSREPKFSKMQNVLTGGL